MNTTRSLIAVAAGLALNIAGIGTGFASTSDDGAELRVVVRYADSELTSGEGVWRVKHRILSAVEQVCPAIDSRDLARRAQVEVCRSQALAGAMSQVKSPQLAEALAGGTHHG
jgi:UrcA family protein